MKIKQSIIILLFIFILPGSTQLSAFLFSGKATLAFTGDIMMHLNVKKCANVMNVKGSDGKSVNNDGFDYLYQKIAPYFNSIDFVSGNMEFPVSPPFKQQGIIFNAPVGAIKGIKEAGFDIVCLANNHILDQYVKGAHDTMGYLDQYKIPYIGVAKKSTVAHNGYIKDVNGIKVGMIGYAGLINYPERNTGNNFHLNWVYDQAQVIKDIKAIKAKSDYVVLQVHTGVEYVLEPRAKDVKLFRQFADTGVDLIIGHHPHMLQSMEYYKTKDGRQVAIFYSLGNFISDQTRSVPVRNSGKALNIRNSVVVQVELQDTFGNISEKVTAIPIHTVHEYKVRNGIRYKDIQTIVIHERINELEEKMKKLNQSTAQYKSLNAEKKNLEYHVQAIELTLFRSGKPTGIDFIK
jgi:poly-gamma-glutamate capsule biosynthesis protein CapA/YwtB (metallophosphatase superfamily)